MTTTSEGVMQVARNVERLSTNIGLCHPGQARGHPQCRRLPARRGSPAARGRPRHRQDLAGPRAGDLAVDHVEPDPVHSRPAALRRHRRLDLQPEPQRVRVPARPGLRQRGTRRRDQPRVAEDAISAARGDGRRHAQQRRHRLPDAATVHGRRYPEPDRHGRHVHPARGAARPLPDEADRRLPERRIRGGRAAHPEDGPDGRSVAARC